MKLAIYGTMPLKKTFEQQLNALIYLHLRSHMLDQHPLQVLKNADSFARIVAALPEDIKKAPSSKLSARAELNSGRGFKSKLQDAAQYSSEFGTLVVIEKLLIVPMLAFRCTGLSAWRHVRADPLRSISDFLASQNGNPALPFTHKSCIATDESAHCSMTLNQGI